MQYKQLKLAYIRLKETKKNGLQPVAKKTSKITEVMSESDENDDKNVLTAQNIDEDEDLDSVRLLYQLEKAQKDKL